ncbi:hypothetical protein MJO28_015729 [Puccinia striiformis f. sp. tritici]|uniref:Brix domain-containing protein n=3 Tax=Puccinia striiformis TaxID=27350 RepID=A0A0L0VAI8_9BASI|nr:hypothetical protein Pst134EB_029956 [Puccinia striiformis f. sp. tritici]KAI9614247.1 hypothetical protein H4Q26_009390 [Puccinia striiformis f. sp. tritici PST-130]KNE95979.1 hypothetical protein PSTG_10670 [Puccinia striiformis f. sp. tritici PST-78]POW16670.1 hypothetical protein PSTT_01120 [Puccinia striiformis]KAI7936355.1 hypothetical protein MJO29_015658 [Puccinia striiformis f. sp. tritici]
MAVINSTSQIANKVTRSKVSKSLKRDKAQAKITRRVQQKKAEAADPSLREARLKANVPRTIERTKEWLGDDEDDERMVPVKVEYTPQTEEGADGAEPGLENVHFDMGRLHDLFAPYMNEEITPQAPTDQPPNPEEGEESHPDQGTSQPAPDVQPRTLITTSPRPSEFTLAFVHELGGLFGGSRNCDVIPRKTKRFELTRVCRWATERGYGSMVVIGEAHGGRNRSGPTHMTISRLPYGPTASFRMTSIVPSKAIPGHAKPTSHFPELVLSNFSTPLGLSIGTLLQSVFPPLPELEGRQVVSMQNQRDFVFFRRYRYVFAEREKVFLKDGDENIRTRLQEIGPRFTLKVRWLKRGTLAGGLNENVLPGQIGKERKLGELERQQEASRAGRRRQERNQETTTKDLITAQSSSTPSTSETIPVSTAQEPIKTTKKRKQKSKTSAGIEEKFLRGERSDSEDPETSEQPRKSGGLNEFMKDVKQRASQGRNTSRQLEWEWKPNMGVSRRKFFL